ncbi:MAG: hypothetical protein J1F01_05525 [Oscillospiraceae bacterium]|nr:hypothetical protein [Oscillospiraceae bacterium]
MTYENDSPAALMAMERDRTGNYGDYDEPEPVIKKCPCCNSKIDVVYGAGQEIREFYRIGGDIIGCNLCVEKIDEYGGEVA